jgi:hypothetical protein
MKISKIAVFGLWFLTPYTHSMKTASSSAMMMEGAGFSETLVHFYQTAWHCKPQHSYLHTYSHDNIKFTVKM